MTVTKRLAGSTATLLNRVVGSRAGGALGMLVYHRIAPHASGLPGPTMNVQPGTFRTQLEGLVQRGYRVWPLREVLDRAASGDRVPPRSLVITFDDGFEGIYTHAWPVLRALGLPATIFLNTAYLDGETFPFDGWGRRWQCQVPPSAVRPLRTDQAVEMHEDGLVDLGAHTHTHLDFRGRPGAFEADLRVNLEQLRDRFGLTRCSFAFPFGRPHLGFVSAELVAAARRTGVRCGLTTSNELVDLTTDPFWWGRFNAYESDSAAVLDAKLAGWYGWIPRVQEWLHGRRSA